MWIVEIPLSVSLSKFQKALMCKHGWMDRGPSWCGDFGDLWRLFKTFCLMFSFLIWSCNCFSLVCNFDTLVVIEVATVILATMKIIIRPTLWESKFRFTGSYEFLLCDNVQASRVESVKCSLVGPTYIVDMSKCKLVTVKLLPCELTT